MQPRPSTSPTAQRRDVIAYTRVSTTDQAVDGISLLAQRAQIGAYCRLHGLRLERVYVDEGLSAKNTTGRPAAQQVIARIRSGDIDGLVICALDRFVRSTRDAIDLADLCRNKGVGLHSIKERLDTTSALGGFFYTLLAALGELERKQIGERTAAALQHLRRCGRKIGGAAPYGFKVEIRQHHGQRKPWLVRDRRERAVIRLVKRLHAEGASLRSIAAELADRQIVTKSGTMNWHPEVVKTLVNTELTA
jgi:site-specific DNA recombinase